MTDTPVGERPASGGRTKEHESDAARARAWRERRKEARGGAEPEVVRPALAEATLSSVLERMAEAMARHQADMGQLVARCEDAIAAVVDPEALSTELAATRAEVALQVADAEDKARSADQRRARAETAARVASEEAQEAGRAADVAWERTETLEAELLDLRAELATAVDRTAEVTAELAATRLEHDQAVAGLRAAAEAERVDALAEQAQGHDEELMALREAAMAEAVRLQDAVGVADVARDEAVHERARAEGEATALRDDLERIRVELPQAVAAARAEVKANLQERHAAELAGARATLQGEVARLEGELAGERSRSAAAQELVVAYRDQLAGGRPPAAARPTPSKAARKRGTAAPQT